MLVRKMLPGYDTMNLKDRMRFFPYSSNYGEDLWKLVILFSLPYNFKSKPVVTRGSRVSYVTPTLFTKHCSPLSFRGASQCIITYEFVRSVTSIWR